MRKIVSNQYYNKALNIVLWLTIDFIYFELKSNETVFVRVYAYARTKSICQI